MEHADSCLRIGIMSSQLADLVVTMVLLATFSVLK